MTLSGSFISKNSYKVFVLLIYMTELGKCENRISGSWTESLVCVKLNLELHVKTNCRKFEKMVTRL